MYCCTGGSKDDLSAEKLCGLGYSLAADSSKIDRQAEESAAERESLMPSGNGLC